MAAPIVTPDPMRVVQVAAAVIYHPDGRFLLARRPRGKVYEGYWEFPGGKIEAGESALAALSRELNEELGIEIERAYPWITRRYTYAHATVDLHFFRVVSFCGEPHAREEQALAWQWIDRIDVSPVLPANGPILAALTLPSVYGITNAAEAGIDAFLRGLDAALAGGLKLIQVREPKLSEESLRRFAVTVAERARGAGARVLLNADLALAEHCALDGVHLKAAQLRELVQRPSFALVGASCHNAEELDRAVCLGVDFVVLGPVAPTPSHPGAEVLGWKNLTRLTRGYPLPVYALGGMRAADIELAWRSGAHGIGMQRGAWTSFRVAGLGAQV